MAIKFLQTGQMRMTWFLKANQIEENSHQEIRLNPKARSQIIEKNKVSERMCAACQKDGLREGN